MKMGNKVPPALRYIVFIIAAFLIVLRLTAKEPARMLILSGQNNHEWKKTTPVLEKMFTGSGLFTVSVTNRPDTLKLVDYKRFRLIVSDWNSFPDTSARWDPSKEEAFSQYIKEGGGALFFHSGGSSFYGWNDYHNIAIGRWGKNTEHGKIGEALVQFSDSKNPITKGLKDFTIIDEIWQNTDICPDAKPLGWVQKKDSNGNLENEKYPAIFVNEIGKGRSFYTIFGHDDKVLSNPDLQKLLIRGAAWVCGDRAEVSGNFGTYNYRSDRKPHFHPLISPSGTILTAESPKDHLWHMGLWFSWKFIDGLNYWEYTGDPTRHLSEGMTEIESIDIDSTKQGGYEINLKIVYHPWDNKESPVMKEVQQIMVSPREKDKSYWINYQFTFTALKDLLLDRTPIPGEQDGQSWGGYSGLSLRLNNDFRDLKYFSESRDDANYGDKNRWVACDFDNGRGMREQVIIFDNSVNPRYPSPWYCINDSATPMFYFSPAILYKEPIKLKKGEVLHLEYKVYLPARPLNRDAIDKL
jgi:type 1 glutamine amidotransferase